MASLVGAIGRPMVLAGAFLTVWLGIAAPGLAGAPQAPFGDKVSAAIFNYNRATPDIATSGTYDAAAVAEVKALGFATVRELRGADEKGVSANAMAAMAAAAFYFGSKLEARFGGPVPASED